MGGFSYSVDRGRAAIVCGGQCKGSACGIRRRCRDAARRLAVPHVDFDLLEGSSALPGRVGRHQPNLDGVHAASQH